MLLVGGQSSRMGSDKATLMMGGEPLWQRQLRVLRELAPDKTWISARTLPDWCLDNVEVILDEPPSRGPLSGITAALAHLRTSHLLALAIDMPKMTAAHIRKLLWHAQPGSGVIPKIENRFEPLCAVYPVEAFNAAHRALSRDHLSLQSFAENLCHENLARSYTVLDSEKHLYLNLNEPAQLRIPP